MINTNSELENSTIGILLTSFDYTANYLNEIKSEYFYQKINQEIIEKAKLCYVSKEEFSEFVIQEHLKSLGYSNSSIMTHIINITHNIITKYELKKNIALLKKIYQDNQFKKILADGINNKSSDTDKSIEEVLQGLYELKNGLKNNNKKGKTMTDVSLEYIDFLSSKEDGKRCDTGFPLIDSMLKGMFKGQLIGLAARPACGKSAFGMTIGMNVAKKGKQVVMFSQEMEAYEVYERMIANQANIPMDNLIEKFKDLDEDTKDIYFDKVIKKANELSKLPITMFDATSLTTTKIRSECQQFKDLGLIIIDYLQLMIPVKKEQNRNLEIAQITRELKILASDLGCPILLLSQLNRVKDETDVPSLNDYRDSGAIEQDLVKSMMLWKTDLEHNRIGLIINKNRRGSTGAVEMKFEGKYMSYTEIGVYNVNKARKKKKSDWSDFDD